MINLIYILIFLILIFVAYLGLKAVSYGIKAKQKNKPVKKFKKKNITNDLLKINNLYKTGAITKKEFQKAKKKILNN